MFNLTTEDIKTNHAIHTASEIYQQPEVWKELSEMMERDGATFQQFIEGIFNKHEQTRVIFTGAGTSAFAGDTLTPALNRQEKRHVQYEAIATTDIVSNPTEYFGQKIPTILVSFARSGNSPESVASVELGQNIVEDFYQVIITCNKDGQLAKNVQNDANSIVLLMPEKSNDQSLAMTSSFSTMSLAAYGLFAYSLFTEKNVQQLISYGEELREHVGDVVDDILTFDFERAIYLGSGSLAQLAHEGALKMLELSSGKVVAYHESSLGFRHGPKSILNNQSLAIVFVSEDEYTRKYDIDILKELAKIDNGMKVVALTGRQDPLFETLADWTIPVVTADDKIANDFYISLLYIVFAQVLAMKKSIQLGNTPDNPSPDGTINRVVEGVTIYPYEQQ